MNIEMSPQNMKLLNALNNAWTPHKGQEQVGHKIFSSPADMIYTECGRKFGKSEFGVYCCWLYALTRPNAEVYYLAPAVKQAKELVWANGRMQTCNTYRDDFIKEIEAIMGGKIKIYYHEMRIVLPNGSFIKVDGSDNYNSQRGLKPDFITADEYRDFKKEWIEAVRPNLSVKPGKILFITTPPHGPNHAYRMAAECRKGMETGDKHYYYLNLPSSTNNRIPNHDVWLAREKKRLCESGRAKEWRREYMAEFIAEDENAIIPQLNRDVMKPFARCANISSNHALELYIAVDPGNTATFGAITAIYDPNTAKLHVLDLLYETDAAEATAAKMWPRIEEMVDNLPRNLATLPKNVVVNPRTPWFIRDLYETRRIASAPLPKNVNDKIYNISLIKDMLSAGDMLVSDKCHELVTEAEMFQKYGEEGKIPSTEGRLLINCLRYLVTACGYTTDKVKVDPPKPKDESYLERWLNAPKAEDRLRDTLAERYGITDWEEGFFIEDYEDVL